MEVYAKIGPLCKTIREGWPAAPQNPYETARRCGYKNLESGAGSIRAFERGDRSLSVTRWKKYLKSLMLSEEQEIVLDQIYQGSIRKNIEVNQDRLSALSFETVAHSRIEEISDLREELRLFDLPAFIMDELWYIHAFNAQIIELFHLTDADLNKPPIWHIIATKYYDQSPVRLAHRDLPDVDAGGNPLLDAYGKEITNEITYGNDYFPRVLSQFLHDISQSFFAKQVFELRKYLCQLSKQSNTDFQTRWDSMITMRTELPLRSSIPRYIHSHGKTIHMAILYSPKKIKIADGTILNYNLVVWKPLDDAAREVNEVINKRAARLDPRDRIVYACDYDIPDYNLQDWSTTLAVTR